MALIEHGFTLFSDDEIEVGIKYAAEKDLVTLNHTRLRTIADNAGKNRVNVKEKIAPRIAAARAIRNFERQYPSVRFSEKVYEAYVHAVAKMFSERNPNTKAKRASDAEVQEILALSHRIDETPDIDPEINRQLSLGLDGTQNEDKADTQ